MQVAETTNANIPSLEDSSIFKTNPNIVITRNSESKNIILPEIALSKQCLSFFDIQVPTYVKGEPSLPIPVDLEKIKKNAICSITNSSKIRFEKFFNENPNLIGLADALVSDSFWFIVQLFQSKNKKYGKKPNEENVKTTIQSPATVQTMKSHSKTKISGKISFHNHSTELKKENPIQEILMRMSRNYFYFFIRVCDLGPTRLRDSYLNEFKNFMAFSVFYSIYLAFPKTRHLFDENFRNRLVGIFGYLFNGLLIENHFRELKWELDLGKGNIIEKFTTYKEDEPLVLPELTELQELLEDNYQIAKYKKTGIAKGKKSTRVKDEVTSDILNTPLYRLYAESNKFETLNLLKPIKMTNRKIIDTELIGKQHESAKKLAKDIIQKNKERNDAYKQAERERLDEYNRQIKEIKKNDKRIKEELAEIKTLRCQEYANYLLFISK